LPPRPEENHNDAGANGAFHGGMLDDRLARSALDAAGFADEPVAPPHA